MIRFSALSALRLTSFSRALCMYAKGVGKDLLLESDDHAIVG